MGTVYYIFMGFIIFFGIIQVFNLLNKSSKESKKELLNKMLENNDINSDIYIKYKKRNLKIEKL